MKIGDKVRFLNATGGGRVAGFQGTDIVLVEDEDGFQIPTLMREVVLEQSTDFSTKHMVEVKGSKNTAPLSTPSDGRSIKAMMRDGQDEEVDLTLPDEVDWEKEVTFRPKAQARKGGNKLSAYLAFVPMNIDRLEEPQLELYLVNDSNYALRYLIMQPEGQAFTLLHEGEIEANTKVFLSELRRQEVQSLDRLTVTAMAFKRDEPFVRKPLVDVTLRVDATRLFKRNAFQDTLFFDTPALLLTCIEADQQPDTLNVDVKTLKQQMYAQPVKQETKKETLLTPRSNDPLVVDLHADSLLDSTQGMQPAEILEHQLDAMRKALNAQLAHPGKKVVLIHGKGEGVLRQAVLRELRYRYKFCSWQDASFREYGYGATQVTIHQQPRT